MAPINLPPSQVIFNQAQFQQMRLHEIMKQINICWTNITGELGGVPAANLLFDNLCAYYLEVEAILTPEEVKAINELLKKVEFLVNNHTMWKLNNSSNFQGTTKTRELDYPTYIVMRNELRTFQSKVLGAAATHGLGNPKKSDPASAVVN